MTTPPDPNQYQNTQPAPIAASPPDPNRTALLRRVQRHWVEGVLAATRAEVSYTTLSTNSSTSLLDAYDSAPAPLFIIGEPGAGKTTQLLMLAERLLDRAEANATHPIPLVISLGAWQPGERTVDEWLIEQLVLGYHVPLPIADQIVRDERVILLLDGLDELPSEQQQHCLTALTDRYRAEGSPIIRAVICGQRETSQLLDADTPRAVVEIQPLGAAQVEDALANAPAALRTLAQADPTWRATLQTPLLLHMSTCAVANISSMSTITAAGDQHTRQWAICAAYTGSMLRAHPPSAPDERRTMLRSLRWVARLMASSGAGVYQLEWVAAGVLDARWQQWVVKQSDLLLVTLVFGIAIALLLVLKISLGITITVGLWYLLSLLFVTIVPISSVIHLGMPSWSWSPRTMWSTLLVLGGLPCLAGGVMAGISGAVACGLLGAVGGVLHYATTKGLVERIPSADVRPNEATIRSLQWACVVTLLQVLGIGLAFGALGWAFAGPQAGAQSGIFFMLMGMLVAAMSTLVPTFLTKGGTAVIRHYTLRLLLVQSGAMPWDIVAMLDAAARRSLLRRVGGGWVFTHRMLLEYFRDLNDEGLEELVKN